MMATAAIALFISACGSNATFSKRYHNRGFSIAWGGGSESTPTEPIVRKARVEAAKSAIVENSVVEMQTEEITSYNADVLPIAVAKTDAVVASKPAILSEKATQKSTPVNAIAKKSADHKVMVKATTKVLKQKKAMADPGEGKSQLIALLLCVFVGVIGIHRFYLGYTKEGVLQLLTAGGCGVWALIDLYRIIIGDLKPKDGDYTETL